MRRLERVVLHKNIGLDGIATNSGNRQVALIESEKWLEVQRELGAEIPWYERRANVLTAGIALKPLLGKRVRLGTAIVEIVGELTPCVRMREIHPGLLDALVPDFRGGVYARIIENGAVEVGAEITPLDGPRPSVETGGVSSSPSA